MNLPTPPSEQITEELEDEYDINSFAEAMEEYKKDKATFPLEDVVKELELE